MRIIKSKEWLKSKLNLGILSLLLAVSVLMLLVSALIYPDSATSEQDKQSLVFPVFSHEGGFYTNSFELSLETDDKETVIYYTLDGSEPNLDSIIYNKNNPIIIENKEGQPNIAANIKTTGFKESGGGVSNVEWHRPSELFKGTVVRARVYKDGELSEIVTRTYLIDVDGNERYSLPLISIVTDSKNVFDSKTGIYVPDASFDGDRFSGNYHFRGREWERPAHIEFYEADGTLGFSSNVGIRIHGFSTRNLPQKSIRIYFRRGYGMNRLHYPMFDDKLVDEFKRILLRNSGSDWYHSMISDGLMHSLVGNLNVDIQGYRPAVHFINGEYWGIINVRERQDKHYIETNHGVKRDEIDLISNVFPTGKPVANEGDTEHWDALISFMEKNIVSNEVNYNYIKTQMEIESFIDYHLIQIYGGNWDYGHHNIKYWRPKTKEGKWRWMLYDTDHSFGNNPGSDFDRNTLQFAIDPNRNAITYPLRRLLTNQQFKIEFINRMADLLNTNFKYTEVIEAVGEIHALISPEMQEHIERWRYPSSMQVWETKMHGFSNYARLRPQEVRQHFINQFNLGGTAQVNLDVSNAQHGGLMINTVQISQNILGENEDPYPWEGTYFKGVPIEITAQPNDGYRFKGWDGIKNDDSNSLQITLKEDIFLTALFEVDDTIILTEPDTSSSLMFIVGTLIISALVVLAMVIFSFFYNRREFCQ